MKSIMGGKVLEYEAKTIKREGIKEGIKEGVESTVSILKNFGISQQILCTVFCFTGISVFSTDTA